MEQKPKRVDLGRSHAEDAIRAVECQAGLEISMIMCAANNAVRNIACAAGEALTTLRASGGAQ